MAKDIDLSSKVWCDLVFEGKNKEFGAYQMRLASVSRHTRALVGVLIFLAVALIFLILAYNGVFERAEDEGADASTEQVITSLATDEDYEEEEEEQTIIEQEPEEIIQPEEIANQQQVTEVLIVQDEAFDDTKEVKNTSETLENEAQFGTMDFSEGVNDINKTAIKEEVVAEAPAEPVEEKVYTMAMVEQKPLFPGGDEAMYKWLGDHLNYPAQASEEGVSGRVVVQFDVSKTGTIENVRVARSRHPALDKEAVRLVKSMPKWQPGRNNGQPVKVTYTLPINFKLQE